jgi:hypothetical protein
MGEVRFDALAGAASGTFVRVCLQGVLAGALGFAASGCSLFFIDAAPSEPHLRTEHAAVECTASTALPILDVAFGSVEAAFGVAAAVESPRATRDNVLSKEARLTVAAVWTGIYAISATYGFVETADCRKLRREVFPEPRPRNYMARNARPPRSAPPGAARNVVKP